MLFQCLVLIAIIAVVLGESVKDLVNQNKVKTVGRIDSWTSETLRADWPGTGIRFVVDGDNSSSDIQINLNFGECPSTCKFFIQPIVDDEYLTPIEVSTAAGFNLKLALSGKTSHDVQLLKQTEASFSEAKGTMELVDLSIIGGSLSTKAMNSQKQKILFVGDSVTCAFGVDGTSPCQFTAATESVFHGYAGLVAKALNAEYEYIAWSGKGIVRNYGDVNTYSSDPMPTYYNKTMATSSSVGNYWQPNKFAADIVYVMLGTNDYSTDPVPEDDRFINGFVTFVDTLRRDYPGAKVILACSPMQRGKQCTNTEIATFKAKTHYLYLDTSLVDPGYGCEGHPNAASHQNIADKVIELMKKISH